MAAENTTDLHRKLPEDLDLRKILCIKEQRTVKNDFTISFRGKLYQILDKIKNKTVTVEIWLDSSIHIASQATELRVKNYRNRYAR